MNKFVTQMDYPKFRVLTKGYYQTGPVESNCTDIEFYNQGTIDIAINSKVLSPGQSWSISGFPFEINKQDFFATFSASTGGVLIVTRRLYDGVPYEK